MKFVKRDGYHQRCDCCGRYTVTGDRWHGPEGNFVYLAIYKPAIGDPLPTRCAGYRIPYVFHRAFTAAECHAAAARHQQEHQQYRTASKPKPAEQECHEQTERKAA